MPSFRTFTGEFPCLHPTLLPENAAQEAINCDFSQGILTGILDRRQIAAPLGVTSPKAMYVHADGAGASKIFAWSRDVDAVRGPVANDAYSRFYWTDGVNLYVSRADQGSGGDPQAAGNAFLAGVPEPVAAPICLSANSNVFIINNIANLYYFLCCEEASGTISNEQFRTPTSYSSTRASMAHALSLSGFSCSATGGGSTGGISYVGPASIGFLAGDAGLIDMPCLAYGLWGGAPYYLFSPQAASVGLVGTTATATIPGIGPLTVYNIGASWFCTQPGVAPPAIDGTTGAATTQATQPTVTVKTVSQTTDGRIIYGMLRTDGQHTLPPEFDGYTAKLVVESNQITITWSRSGAIEARAYVVTFVNTYGEEGAPSAPLEMDGYSGEELWFSYTEPLVNGYAAISSARLYRSAGTTGKYLFVSEAPFRVGLRDNVKTESLGETLATLGYRPPESGVKGLVALPNGVLAAFKGNEIHFCEPYLPYAWKRENILTAAMPVVGLCAAEGGLYATTKSGPYFISGMTPDAMSQIKMTVPQAGVSKGSIVNIGQAVVYASHDGLVSARGADASLDFSFKFFTRAEWRKRYGSKLNQLRLNAHDGHLLAWFEDGTPGFLIRYDETQAALTQLNEPVYAAVVHPDADALYLAVGQYAYEFKGNTEGRAHDFLWHSKDFVLPKPVNLGVLHLEGEGRADVTVYADGVAVLTQPNVFMKLQGVTLRLPSGFLASRWSVRLDCGAWAHVRFFGLVGTPSELRNG